MTQAECHVQIVKCGMKRQSMTDLIGPSSGESENIVLNDGPKPIGCQRDEVGCVMSANQVPKFSHDKSCKHEASNGVFAGNISKKTWTSSLMMYKRKVKSLQRSQRTERKRERRRKLFQRA